MLVHWIWYAMLPKLSLRQKCMLLTRFPDPEELYHTEDFGNVPEIPADVAHVLEDKDLRAARQVVKTCAEKHISILTLGDAAYPSRLRNIADPPLVLYYRGVLPDLEGQPVIAVVGTRKASAYGLNNARHMSRQIAACGGLVVSGGAFGVDTMALEGALETGAQTVAVLGCGADVVYPKNNKKLFDRIVQNGCLISEYLPGTEPRPWQFPERNRIISGLSNGVLVIEAPEKSGALITARRAFEQGRDVFAVPGNIDIDTFAGSNALLQDCAAAALSGWDVMKDYASQYPDIVEKREPVIRADADTVSPQQMQLQGREAGPSPDADKKYIDNPKPSAYIDLGKILSQLDPEERQIVACLDSTPRPVDEVIAQAGLPAGKVLSALTRLALKGVVTNHPGRLVSAKKQ